MRTVPSTPLESSPLAAKKTGPLEEVQEVNPYLEQKEPAADEEMAPVDQGNRVLRIFLLWGIGTLLPWNAILNELVFFSDEVGALFPIDHSHFFRSLDVGLQSKSCLSLPICCQWLAGSLADRDGVRGKQNSAESPGAGNVLGWYRNCRGAAVLGPWDPGRGRKILELLFRPVCVRACQRHRARLSLRPGRLPPIQVRRRRHDRERPGRHRVHTCKPGARLNAARKRESLRPSPDLLRLGRGPTLNMRCGLHIRYILPVLPIL